MMLFCFMFGFYVSQRSVLLFIERRKIFIAIESLFSYYNGRKIIHELIYSDQRPKNMIGMSIMEDCFASNSFFIKKPNKNIKKKKTNEDFKSLNF